MQEYNPGTRLSLKLLLLDCQSELLFKLKSLWVLDAGHLDGRLHGVPEENPAERGRLYPGWLPYLEPA
ncbi:hypothetical protein LAZ67_3001735, partial [Cordylochernes scorpioides]